MNKNMRLSRALGGPENTRSVRGEIATDVGIDKIQIASFKFPVTTGYAAACRLKLYHFGFDVFIKAVDMMDKLYMQDERTRLINSELKSLLEETSAGPEIISQNADLPVCQFIERLADQVMAPHYHVPVSYREITEEFTRTRGQVM